MALLTVDVAFDWDSNPKSGFDGFCLCGASGFDMAVPGRNQPPGQVGIRRSDQLQFQVWDISDQAADRTVSNIAIAFQSAHSANTAQFPFQSSEVGSPTDGWYPLANLSLGSRLPGGNSGVYGGPFPNWQVSPRPLSLASAGWYFFRVSFDVTTGSTTKSFGNDPEMIVRD